MQKTFAGSLVPFEAAAGGRGSNLGRSSKGLKGILHLRHEAKQTLRGRERRMVKRYVTGGI